MIEKYTQMINNVFYSFLIDALAMITVGVIIFVFPDLLGMLVGGLFVLIGVKYLFFAFKFKKISSLNK